MAILVRRVRDRTNPDLLCVGTSATMATEGTAADRAQTVASVASRLFGAEVKRESVVTETLQRITPEQTADPSTLAASIRRGVQREADFDGVRQHPIAAWIETNLGLAREDGKADGRWVRTSRPRTLQEAGGLLAEASTAPAEECFRFLRDFLLLAHNTTDGQGRSLFAFRLHQFMAGAGDVFATLEAPGSRGTLRSMVSNIGLVSAASCCFQQCSAGRVVWSIIPFGQGFDLLDGGTLTHHHSGWPSKWTLESEDRAEFIEQIRWFSSNYAPQFGRLLTPIVDGIRVRGPLFPSFNKAAPKLVLLDGQGLGHTPDSSAQRDNGDHQALCRCGRDPAGGQRPAADAGRPALGRARCGRKRPPAEARHRVHALRSGQGC